MNLFFRERKEGIDFSLPHCLVKCLSPFTFTIYPKKFSSDGRGDFKRIYFRNFFVVQTLNRIHNVQGQQRRQGCAQGQKSAPQKEGANLGPLQTPKDPPSGPVNNSHR